MRHASRQILVTLSIVGVFNPGCSNDDEVVGAGYAGGGAVSAGSSDRTTSGGVGKGASGAPTGIAGYVAVENAGSAGMLLTSGTGSNAVPLSTGGGGVPPNSSVPVNVGGASPIMTQTTVGGVGGVHTTSSTAVGGGSGGTAGSDGIAGTTSSHPSGSSGGVGGSDSAAGTTGTDPAAAGSGGMGGSSGSGGTASTESAGGSGGLVGTTTGLPSIAECSEAQASFVPCEDAGSACRFVGSGQVEICFCHMNTDSTATTCVGTVPDCPTVAPGSSTGCDPSTSPACYYESNGAQQLAYCNAYSEWQLDVVGTCPVQPPEQGSGCITGFVPLVCAYPSVVCGCDLATNPAWNCFAL